MPCLGGHGQRDEEEDDDDGTEGFTITPWDRGGNAMVVNWASFEEPDECVDLDHVRPEEAHDDEGTSGIRSALDRWIDR